ncbi:MAG: TetR family transcriptional regulator [Pseudomonadota bacterium]
MTETQIKIGDLSDLSGVSKSTIHHYLRIGILHPPQKVGTSRTAYDSSHLRILHRIHDLREMDRLSLAAIRQVLLNENCQSQKPYQNRKKDKTDVLINNFKDLNRKTKEQKHETKRILIIDAASDLFARNGYEKTSIKSIADALHISKSTVYIYFKNKDHLFMKCMDRLTFFPVPESAWSDIQEEKNPLRRLQKRATVFHNFFPNYNGLLRLIKTSLGSGRKKMIEKARTAMSLMTKPIKEDICQGVASGLFQTVNEDIISHLILSTGEGLGYRLMIDSHYSMDEAVQITYDFISNGILKNPSGGVPESTSQSVSGEITDIKGNKNIVSEIFFGKDRWLPVKMGEAHIKLFPHNIKRLTFEYKETSLCIKISTSNGQTEWGTLDGSMKLSGIFHFGEFNIDLGNVDSIRFNL